jgi:tol-pal system protein YbgF
MSRIPDMLKTMKFPIPGYWSGALTRWGAVAMATVMLSLAAPAGARAQAAASPEIQSLLQRIERLQRDMNTLQRRVYRGEAPAAAAAPTDDTGSAPLPGGSNLAAAMQVRLDEIETQMRAFTGRLEETNHAISELTKKLEALTGDIDVRFQSLLSGAPATGATTAGTGAPPAAAAAPAKPGVLGTLSLKDVGKSGVGQARLAAPNGGKSNTAPESILPKGTAQAQYQFATSFLARSDWTRAEQALTAFMAAHGKHPLAGNAQYWLGESHYVRGDYSNAALAFAKGYKEFPKSAKGPDNLLKLGLSLANLKKTSSACKTFARVAKDFPGASAAIKSRAAAERKKLRCR